MEILTADKIPAWIVGINWIYAGFIWMATRGATIRLDSRIWGITFILAGLVYLLGYIPSPSSIDIHSVEILEFRLYITRILMIMLSVSMWLPMTISYYRMVKRGEHKSN